MVNDGYDMFPGVSLGITCDRDEFDALSLESALFLELSEAPFLGIFIVVDKTARESECTLEWVIKSCDQKDLMSDSCRSHYDGICSHAGDLGWSFMMMLICRTHCSKLCLQVCLDCK